MKPASVIPCPRVIRGRTSAALAAIAALLLVPAQPAAADWLQWRGPHATGAVEQGSPPVAWSDTENVKWKLEVPGSGASTPIVIGDLVIVLSAIQTGREAEPPAVVAPGAEAVAEESPRRRRGGGGGGGGRRNDPTPTQFVQFCVIAVDRHSGEVQWQTVVREEVPHEGHHNDHGYASNSPVSNGEHIYAFFGSQGLYCLNLEGEVQWERDFGRMTTRGGFGEGSSPALHGDVLVVNWDHEGDDFIVAVDKNTGEDLWRRDRDEPTSWATPLIIEHNGTTQAVVSATNRVCSYDLATGDVIWEIGGMTTNVIPSPVTDGERVYLLSGFRGAALLAVDLGHTGDLTGTDAVAWSHDRSTPYVPSPLLSGDRLYFFAGNAGTLSCFDTDGQVLLDGERIAELLGGVYASPVAADGRVYLIGRSGMVVVMQDGAPFEVLATNQLDDRFDASAAIVGDQLFLRGQRYLYCIAE